MKGTITLAMQLTSRIMRRHTDSFKQPNLASCICHSIPRTKPRDFATGANTSETLVS